MHFTCYCCSQIGYHHHWFSQIDIMWLMIAVGKFFHLYDELSGIWSLLQCFCWTCYLCLGWGIYIFLSGWLLIQDKYLGMSCNNFNRSGVGGRITLELTVTTKWMFEVFIKEKCLCSSEVCEGCINFHLPPPHLYRKHPYRGWKTRLYWWLSSIVGVLTEVHLWLL